ncbi:peptidyl-tRNA hydrolase Pth2 [Candidatus Woesearchaeota archaeon]|nr:peptidyl-tRNA hydrolase Pth2 [Candidatus Woesearchaeota archaeon]MCF7901618.1 peptidyl-tRNA hydrolase Pth2 [Candidatus Woesearchaeota archaeon]
MELKQVIIVRNDLKMPKGKLAAQVAHGSVQAMMHSDKKIVEIWSKQGMKKSVLKVDSEKELRTLLITAKNEGLACGLINDAGRTCLAPGTTTVLGIGPDEEEKIDKVTGHLKLL